MRIFNYLGVCHVDLFFRLQFTYKGQTATLQSPSDIAAWLEERKKRFPTKARAEEVAERKRKLQEAQKAANEARKEKQDKRKAEIKEKQKPEDPNEAAQKAKLKAEKLRRQLKREEKRIARAEAEAAKAKKEANPVKNSKITPDQGTESKKRKRGGSIASTTSVTVDGHDEVKVESMGPTKNDDQSVVEDKVIKKETPDQTAEPDELQKTPTEASTNALQPTNAPPVIKATIGLPSEPSVPIPDLDNESILPDGSHVSIETADDNSMSISPSSSDISSNDDDDDDTSSSGSSSNDDAPEEAPSTRNGPIRVLPPKRERPKTICRDFLQKGHCKRGDSCKFRHELPERGSSSAAKTTERGSKGGKEKEGGKRIGLYQRVCKSFLL